MVKYVNAKPGMKWQLTELGFELGRVRAKYEMSYSHRTQYEKQVPASWVEKGYVSEVAR